MRRTSCVCNIPWLIMCCLPCSLVLQTLAGKGYLSSVLDYRQQSDWPLSQPPRAPLLWQQEPRRMHACISVPGCHLPTTCSAVVPASLTCLVATSRLFPPYQSGISRWSDWAQPSCHRPSTQQQKGILITINFAGLLAGAGCSNSTVDVVTAGGFSRAWQYLFSSEEKPKELASASATANSDSAVLLAHSYGGAPGFDVLFGAPY